MTQQQLDPIRKELEANRIPTTGLYSTLPEIVYYAVIAIQMNGFENWNNGSILGDRVKMAVKSIAEKYNWE